MQTKRLAIVTTQLVPLSVGAFALLFSTACAGADDASPEGDEAFIASETQELRARRQYRQARQAPAAGSGNVGATASGVVATSGSASTGASWSIDPVTGAIVLPPMDPNVDPNSGVNFNDLSNAAVDTGGSCANNRRMSGACPSYGVQCVFEEAGVTGYCTCLHFSSQGIQGWECR